MTARTQFHEDQEVEVLVAGGSEYGWRKWRKAKIIDVWDGPDDLALNQGDYAVQFPDGTRGVFGEAHIRAAFTGFTCEIDCP